MLTPFQKAQDCYSRMSQFRNARFRFKRFTYGSQWDDWVRDPHGNWISEGELASRNGRVPLTNNLIQRVVKTIVGHFRTENKDTPSDHNRLPELDARMLEEFLVSGCAVQRVVKEKRPQGDGTWVDNVNPADFFCSVSSDPRGHDLEVVGMIHDWSIDQAVARFANGSRQRARELTHDFTARQGSGGTFPPVDDERVRIVEVWTLETTGRLRCHDHHRATCFVADPEREDWLRNENRRRARRKMSPIEWRYESVTAWHGRCYDCAGNELASVTAERHPFAVKFYPLLDGEVHSFVEGLLDQQKYVNRLITLIDNMMSTSAKGVLLFPEDEMSDQVEWDDIQKLWASYDGVIPYRPTPGSPGPHQVVTNPASSGAYDLLNLEMRLFDQAGGVTGAFRGEAQTGTGNSAQLFEAQTRNSLAALADIYCSFNDFRQSRDQLLK